VWCLPPRRGSGAFLEGEHRPAPPHACGHRRREGGIAAPTRSRHAWLDTLAFARHACIEANDMGTRGIIRRQSRVVKGSDKTRHSSTHDFRSSKYSGAISSA
jgi:hypothetical protein